MKWRQKLAAITLLWLLCFHASVRTQLELRALVSITKGIEV